MVSAIDSPWHHLCVVTRPSPICGSTLNANRMGFRGLEVGAWNEPSKVKRRSPHPWGPRHGASKRLCCRPRLTGCSRLRSRAWSSTQSGSSADFGSSIPLRRAPCSSMIPVRERVSALLAPWVSRSQWMRVNLRASPRVGLSLLFQTTHSGFSMRRPSAGCSIDSAPMFGSSPIACCNPRLARNRRIHPRQAADEMSLWPRVDLE